MMRIVHAANFNHGRYGQLFNAGTDRKLNNGFIRNGHFAYDFSYRDVARYEGLFKSKKFGVGKTNTRLIEACANVQPEFLCLGHTEFITARTLQIIREKVPGIRIALYWVDPIWIPSELEHIHRRLEFLDAVFLTTGGEHLQQFHTSGTTAAFLPNPVDPSMERHRNFEKQAFDVDLIYCGKVGGEEERMRFLRGLRDEASDMRLEIYGSMGRPLIFGADFDRKIGSTRMGLNFSRRNDVCLYSSDRLMQLTGNGLLTFTPRVPELDVLFSEDEVVYFDDVDDLLAKARAFLQDDPRRQRHARAGWDKAHSTMNERRIAQYVVEAVFEDSFSQDYAWKNHVLR
ncbi:MAG: glycosyltransferase [Phycisphaerae bacterium]|nr:glycosyltransferase [Phycisphaerae bacterium]